MSIAFCTAYAKPMEWRTGVVWLWALARHDITGDGWWQGPNVINKSRNTSWSPQHPQLKNHTDHNAAKDPDNSDMFFDMWWVHIHIDISSSFKVHTKTWHQHSHIVWHLLWQSSCHISSEIIFAMYSDICSSNFCVIFILWQQLSLVVWHLIWQTSCDI
jgi:hypothetical protein